MSELRTFQELAARGALDRSDLPDYCECLEVELEKAKADSNRLDRFLYLNICMSDEGWHPRNRDEFDTILENVEAGIAEESRLQREVEEEPDHE
jgi:hypothetical protein